MTKPHEETWEATPILTKREPHWGIKVGDEVVLTVYAETCLVQRHIDEAKEKMPARVRLAAQAPAMARLLLELEWAGSGFRDTGNVRTTWKACPRCFEHKGTPHKEDCELATVLRAAGVLP